MEGTEYWTCSSEGTSDSEVQLLDLNDDDHDFASGHIPKLQPRKVTSWACWNSELGMAEVVELRGQMWKTMGIVRDGRIYCSIEESLFMAERGALLLLDGSDTPLSLKDIYVKISDQRNGCSWESFQVYRHFKSLSYIVRRHGVAWTMKRVKSDPPSLAKNGRRDEGREDKSCDTPELAESGVRDEHGDGRSFITGLFNKMQINEGRPVFDVYLPNSKFRRSSPGDPSFLLCLARACPPSFLELEDLERECNDIPFKLCQFEHGRVNVFSFNRTVLPILP